MGKPKKIIVFDMDETLGYLSQIGLLWFLIIDMFPNTDESIFYLLMDNYSEYLRPNIINVLNYIKLEKQQNRCDQVVIYTNNQGPPTWPILIKKYFNHKLNYDIFDKVILSYKIYDSCTIIEKKRTSQDKTLKDLLNCLGLKYNDTDVCFIDDKLHKQMIDKRVYYIRMKGYRKTLHFSTIIDKFYTVFKNTPYCKKNFLNMLKKVFESKYSLSYNNIPPSPCDYCKQSEKLVSNIKTFISR